MVKLSSQACTETGRTGTWHRDVYIRTAYPGLGAGSCNTLTIVDSSCMPEIPKTHRPTTKLHRLR